MNTHFIVTADHGHLRIFSRETTPGQMTPSLRQVQALDFPHGKQSYTADDSDAAGRFQGSKQQGRGPGAPAARSGMSIDERLPMQLEARRRELEDVTREIETFLLNRPDASWDFAAGPQVHNAVIQRLSPRVRQRLRQSVPKDLVNQPTTDLFAHFNL